MMKIKRKVCFIPFSITKSNSDIHLFFENGTFKLSTSSTLTFYFRQIEEIREILPSTHVLFLMWSL